MSVGVHQGSVLIPLLFILLQDALSQRFNQCRGVPWDLLYADDFLIMADTLDEWIARLRIWKTGMESKGLRVNMKRQVPDLTYRPSSQGLWEKNPSAGCQKGIGSNYIACSVQVVGSQEVLRNIRPAGSQPKICLPQTLDCCGLSTVAL